MSAFRRNLVAWLALVAVTSGLSTPLVAMHAGYDPDVPGSGPVLVARTAPCLVDGAARPPAPEHCAVCHWMSAIASVRVGATHVLTVARATETVPPATAPSALTATPLSPGPSRAPPVR